MQATLVSSAYRSPYDAGMPHAILSGVSDPVTDVMKAWASGSLGGAIASVDAVPDTKQRASLLVRLAFEDFARGGAPGAAERLVSTSEPALRSASGDDPWPAVAYAAGVAALAEKASNRMRERALQVARDVRKRTSDPDALVALAPALAGLRNVTAVPDRELEALAQDVIARTPQHSGACRIWAECVGARPVREPGSLARAYADLADTDVLTQAESALSISDVRGIESDHLLCARVALAARDSGGAARACDEAADGEAWVPRIRARIAFEHGRFEQAREIAASNEPWAVMMAALCALAHGETLPADAEELTRTARSGRPVDVAELVDALAPHNGMAARRVLAEGLGAHPGSTALRSCLAHLLKGRLKPCTVGQSSLEISSGPQSGSYVIDCDLSGYTGLEV